MNLIVKADVTGSLEALTESLRKLERDEVKLAFVRRGVGGITKDDIQLAATSNATIIGFNVRPDRKAREMADQEHVEIRTYEIIYQVLEDIENAMLGLLAPEFEEVVTGEAEVREIFRVPRVGAIAGCYVLNGTITRELEGPLPAGGHHHLEGRHQLAAALQGRRARGADRLRVRHRPLRLPGPEAGRHHRDLRGSRDPADLTAVRAGGRHVLALTVDLRLPDATSLKEKRVGDHADHRGRRGVAIGGGGRDRTARTRTSTPSSASWPCPASAGHVDRGDRRGRAVRWSFPEIEVVATRAPLAGGRLMAGRRAHGTRPRQYPRTARLNRLLRRSWPTSSS